MTHQKNDTQEPIQSQESFEAVLREKLQQAVRTALISVLEAEVDAFIGAVRYQHSNQRCDYRNGHYTRGLDTHLGHLGDLPVPRTRGGYRTQLFERYHRRQNELDQTIVEMFVGGVSMTGGWRGGRNFDRNQAECFDGLPRFPYLTAAFLNDGKKTSELRPRAKGKVLCPSHPSLRNASTNEERGSRIGTQCLGLFPDQVSVCLPPNRTDQFLGIRLSSHSQESSWC
jgi:Transposase, Mutator family